VEDKVNIQISNASSDPIYLQIKNQIKASIISGKLRAEEQLPSIRYLAKELRVSVITTKRAYDELEIEGFINSVQGKGSFVSIQNKELIREEQLRKVEASLLDAIKGAELAGLSIEELKDLLETLGGVEDDQ
jgi:GntR family transcriptional regulator